MIYSLSVWDLKFDARVYMMCLSKSWPSLTKEISLRNTKKLTSYEELMNKDIELESVKA